MSIFKRSKDSDRRGSRRPGRRGGAGLAGRGRRPPRSRRPPSSSSTAARARSTSPRSRAATAASTSVRCGCAACPAWSCASRSTRATQQVNAATAVHRRLRAAAAGLRGTALGRPLGRDPRPRSRRRSRPRAAPPTSTRAASAPSCAPGCRPPAPTTAPSSRPRPSSGSTARAGSCAACCPVAPPSTRPPPRRWSTSSRPRSSCAAPSRWLRASCSRSPCRATPRRLPRRPRPRRGCRGRGRAHLARPLPARPRDHRGAVMGLRERLHDLAKTSVEHQAESLREQSETAGGDDLTALAPRHPAYVCGTVRTVTLPPRRSVPALVAEVWDGNGSVNLVWIGRRTIGGIEPGVFLRAAAASPWCAAPRRSSTRPTRSCPPRDAGARDGRRRGRDSRDGRGTDPAPAGDGPRRVARVDRDRPADGRLRRVLDLAAGRQDRGRGRPRPSRSCWRWCGSCSTPRSRTSPVPCSRPRIAAFFAVRSGRAEAAFLPGILTNAAFLAAHPAVGGHPVARRGVHRRRR